MQKWNGFLGPLVFLNEQKKFTLALALSLFRAQFEVDWNAIMAMSFLVTLPPLVIFFLAQEYFIQSVVVTGVKG